MSDWADTVLAHARSRPPTLGSGRLVCIDGLAGAGKTTLASAIGELAPATVIHADDLLEGWSGLPRLGASIQELLDPLTRDEPSSWRRWDWHTSGWAERHPVSPVDLLVIEGVGSGAAAYDELITTLVFVEAEREVRLDRGLARDGMGMRAEWLQWFVDEEVLHLRDRTRERADLVVTT